MSAKMIEVMTPEMIVGMYTLTFNTLAKRRETLTTRLAKKKASTSMTGTVMSTNRKPRPMDAQNRGSVRTLV